MHIDSTDAISGIPILRVRGLMRSLQGRWMELDHIAGALEIDEQAARALIDELVGRGYLEPFDDFSRPVWVSTIAGSALAMASAAAPVKRSTAERQLAAFLGRLDEVNADGELLHWCTRVWLFGSMLDPVRDRVNDIDLAIELVRRTPDNDAFIQASYAFAERQQQEGRTFSNVVEFLVAPELELKRRLRAGSRLLSLHDSDDEGFTTGPSRLVYEFEPPRS